MDFAGSSDLEEDLAEGEVVDFGPAFAVGVGAGTDWFLTERLSVRLEARNHLWRLTTPQAFTTTGEEDTEWTNNLGLTLGAALYF
jgi:hypothetical protein